LWSVSYLQSIVNHSLRRRFGERNIMVLRASKTPSMSQRGGLRHIVSNGETAGANPYLTIESASGRRISESGCATITFA
jgi:hypothetical protein